MQALEEIERIARDPHGRLRELKDGEDDVVGFFCSYVPEELIHAAGLQPVRLILGSEPGRTAGKYMQSFCCSFARSILEGIGDGTLDYLSAVVMPHTCDTIRNLSDLIGPAAPGLEVIPFMAPTVTHTPEAMDFMVEEIESLKEALERYTSREITGTGLRESIRLYNRCRETLEALGSKNLGAAELYAAHLAFQLMDKTAFLELADSVESRGEAHPGVRIAVVGGPMPRAELFSTLFEHGLQVVFEDLCTGSRYADGQVDEAGEPLRALAERYLGKVSCPTKSDPEGIRARSIVEGARSSGAEGVIFVVENLCEFHAFDYPELKEMLDAAGLPSLKLELSYPFEPAGQDLTRIQAFAETLTGKV